MIQAESAKNEGQTEGQTTLVSPHLWAQFDDNENKTFAKRAALDTLATKYGIFSRVFI